MRGLRQQPRGEVSFHCRSIAVAYIATTQDRCIGRFRQMKVEARLKSSEVQSRLVARARIQRIGEIVVNVKLVAGGAPDDSDIARDTLLKFAGLAHGVVGARVSATVDA